MTSPSPLNTYNVVSGIKFPVEFQLANLKSGLAYKAKDSDTFIVTYPKCGTNWMKQIAALLVSDIDVTDNDLYERCLFLEAKGAENIQPDTILVDHFPIHVQPWNDKAKYIVVIRNPKDACVSFYYHFKAMPSIDQEITFDQFFELWIEGDIWYNDYFDWILNWWAKRGLDNVHFVVYEELKTNFREELLKLAKFLGGQELVDKLLSNNEQFLEHVKLKSSVDYMKESINTMTQKRMASLFKDGNLNDKSEIKAATNRPKIELVRKGIIGDCHNHLTNEQNQRIEKKLTQKFAGTELETIWGKYNV